MSSVKEGVVLPFKELESGYLGDLSNDRACYFQRELSRFDLRTEDLKSGPTFNCYEKLLGQTTPSERERIYERMLAAVRQNELPATNLLCFVIFEPNLRLVQIAVHDFIVYRACSVVEEFEGVHEVIGLMDQGFVANRGAALAGLVAVGDRRINAVARAARRNLSLTDIRNYSRAQSPKLRNSSVEFCLDWLVELNQGDNIDAVAVVACTLTLMVFHDEYGVVEDLSEINYVGFKATKVLQTQTFESYFCEIQPILDYLRGCKGFESAIDSVITSWEAHRKTAAQLRETTKPQAG